VTNRDFARALGRALGRPAVLPVPAAALQALYGEMATIVTEGQRVVPARALALGFGFAEPDLDRALRAALAR
jgi:NAD dependent epimerase/dehydratase family enzyme